MPYEKVHIASIMLGVTNLEKKSNETPQNSRYETDDEVFGNIPAESTLRKRKVDNSKMKFPRLSSFNMSALRLSSGSNSETSKVESEGSNFNTDEEELRCSPMIQGESPVLSRKKTCCSYALTPRKTFNRENKFSDNSLHEPLRLSESINDSNISPDELSHSLSIIMQDSEQMKSEKVCTPHGLICPPAQCPQRPSKIRKSDASIGGERSCRLLFTKSEDAMKDAITSYGCDAGICVSQNSEKPITPSDFEIELKQGSLDFNVQASGSNMLEPKITEDVHKNITQVKMAAEKITEKENSENEFSKETLDIQLFGKNIGNFDTSVMFEMEHVPSTKAGLELVNSTEVDIEPIKILDNVEHILHVNNEIFKRWDVGNSDLGKDKSLSENENLENDDIDKTLKLGSAKSANVLNDAISENDGKLFLGLSTPILKVDVDYPQILGTPTHDQSCLKSSNLISNPFVAPTVNADKYLGNFVSSSVRLLLTPTDSPINSPGSNSSCSCSCTECDFSPPSAAKAKIMSQTIESSNEIDSENQMPQIIDVMNPLTVENNDLNIQENIIESTNKIDINRSARNYSLTSTPKDLTPHSVQSNATSLSGISPLLSSTPRPKHKHKHDHHHHHHKHHKSMHHLSVYSNSHHHMTSDGDILITSTPLNRQNLVEELVKEEISALGSNIDSVNSDIFGNRSHFVMSDLCGSDKSANHYNLSKIVLNEVPENDEIEKNSRGGGAMYITGAFGSGSLEVQDNKESASDSKEKCKLHLGMDVSPEVWMMDESVLLPRRASSVDETLFRVLSQESPVCLSLN